MKTSYKPEDVIVLLKDIATKKFYRKKRSWRKNSFSLQNNYKYRAIPFDRKFQRF